MTARKKVWLILLMVVVALGFVLARLDVGLVLENGPAQTGDSTASVESGEYRNFSTTSITTEKPSSEMLKYGKVVFVADGDTVRLADGNFVRLIGIDALERGRPGYSESREVLRNMVAGKTVELEKDKTNRDEYGRLLRYVWLDDTLVNREMVDRGWARSMRYEPDIQHQSVIEKAEKEARTENRGIWGL